MPEALRAQRHRSGAAVADRDGGALCV